MEDAYGNDITANPTPPSSTFGDAFDRLTNTLGLVGSNYLTAQGQLQIAQATAAAQARINGYSAVNPSLGAVNPDQAQAVANQTWVQRYLPMGSPVVGAPNTGQQTGATDNSRLLIYGLFGVLIILVMVRFLRGK